MSCKSRWSEPVPRLGVHAMNFVRALGPEGLQQGILRSGRPDVVLRALDELLKPCNSLPRAVSHVEVGGRGKHHGPEAGVLSIIQKNAPRHAVDAALSEFPQAELVQAEGTCRPRTTQWACRAQCPMG